MHPTISTHVHHCTPQPFRFFGRDAELAMLRESLVSPDISLVAFIGPGGPSKTATVQHWLEQISSDLRQADGVFFWSFYRGKDAELCLRQLLADVTDAAVLPEVSSSYCVDRLLQALRSRKWVVVFDGAEVVQHE